MNHKVDSFIGRANAWADEMNALRTVLLGCQLSEDIKWGKPCYSHDDKNIAILQPMKEFLALMFFKGALVNDNAGLLVSQGPNSRSALRIEFRSTDDIRTATTAVIDYVTQAIEIERQGLNVGPAPALELVDELRERLAADDQLAAAFNALTPGRQREYNLHIASAKQASTRHDRIDRAHPHILAGKGLRD